MMSARGVACAALLAAALGCAHPRDVAHDGTKVAEAARAIAELQSEDPSVWVPASLKIERMQGWSEPVAGLCEVLEDERQPVAVRARAGSALTHIGSPAVAPLSRQLDQFSATAPVAAARVLGELGDSAAAVPLLKFLEEPRSVTDAVRTRAEAKYAEVKLLLKLLSLYPGLTRTLPQFDGGRGIREDGGEQEAQAAAQEFLRELNEEIEEETTDSAGVARKVAAQAIGQLKEPSTTARLLVLLADRRAAAEARAAATGALGALRDPVAVPALLTALQDEWPLVRAGAAEALGAIGDLRATAALQQSTDDADPPVRGAAGTALGRIGGWGALAALAEAALGETDTAARWRMTRGLQYAGRRMPLPRLLEDLRSADPSRRQASASALAEILFGDKTALLAGELAAVFADPGLRAAAAARLPGFTLGRTNSLLQDLVVSADIDRRPALIASVLKDGLASEKRALFELAADGKWTTSEEVVAALTSSDPAQRIGAVLRIGLVGERAQAAAGPLIDLLASRSLVRAPSGETVNAREAAADALVQLGTAAVAPLIAALADPEKAEYAARALGDLKDPAAVGPLAELVRRAAPDSAEKAAAALAGLRLPRTADLLLEIASDRAAPFEARRLAITALGAHGDHRAFAPLTKALRGDVTVVRTAAATSLGRLRDLRAVEPLAQALTSDSHELRREAAGSLGRIRGARALSILAMAAESEPLPYVRTGILEALFSSAWSEGRSTPLGPFLAGLSDRDGTVREAAAGKLAQIPDDRKVEIMTGLLHDPRVARYAVRALKGSRGPDAVAPLIEALGSPQPLVSLGAAESLGEIRDKAAVGPLIALLTGPDRRLAAAAAGALGKIGDRNAEAALLAAIEQPGLEVGPEFPAAYLALNRAPAVEFYVAALRVRPFQERAIEALAGNGETAVSPLLAALRDADPVRRAGAAKALGRIASKGATEALIGALRDEDAGVRGGALEGLARIGDERASSALAAALRQEDPAMRRQAAIAIRTAGGGVDRLTALVALKDPDPVVREQAVRFFGERREIEVVVSALDDEAEKVRETAIWKLREIGAPAVDSLLVALANDSPLRRAHAARALSEIRDPRSLMALTAALEDADAAVRTYALYALKTIGDRRSVEVFIARLRDENADVRMVAVSGLIGSRDPRAVQPLIAALDDPSDEVVAYTAGVLCVFRDPRAVEPLIRLLASPHWRVRGAAAATLGCLGDGRAVGPLVASLRKIDSRETTDVLQALTRITGQDFGITVDKWRSWWQESGRAAYPGWGQNPR